VIVFEQISHKFLWANPLPRIEGREICPKTITLLLCKLMDNHQTCSPPIASPKLKKARHLMTSPIKHNPVTPHTKTDHPKTLFLRHVSNVYLHPLTSPKISLSDNITNNDTLIH
jgi:hypothetical protein